MEPRHFDQRDEDVSEAPWGAVARKRKPLLEPKLRAAMQRYRLARAARRAGGNLDEPLGAVDAIQPIAPIRNIRIR